MYNYTHQNKHLCIPKDEITHPSGMAMWQRYWKWLFRFPNFGRFRDVSRYPYCRVIILCRNVYKNENIPNRFFSGRTKNNWHFGYLETKITDFKISVTRLGTTLHHCRLILETEMEPGTKSRFHYLCFQACINLKCNSEFPSMGEPI